MSTSAGDPDQPGPEPANRPANQSANEPGSGPKRGADLARDALAAARARTAARRSAAVANPTTRRRIAGTRRRWSGAAPDSRDPAPFGALARRWVKQTGNPTELAQATVIAQWVRIVGPDIAHHCEPIGLLDGVLTIRAESTAWATQIRLLSTTVLAKLASAVGANQVRSLRVQGPSGPSWKFGPRSVPGRGPRDTYG